MPYLPLSPTNPSGFFANNSQEVDYQQQHNTSRFSAFFTTRRLLLSLLFGLPFVFWFASSDGAKEHMMKPTAALEQAWQKMGQQQDLEFPVCDKTFLYTFAGTKGFGSELGIFVRGALWAKHHNYTLLVADDEWVYGRFEDYFELPPLDCKPDPEAYKNKGEGVVSVGASGWQEAKRLSMVRGQYGPIDMWMMRDMMDVDAILALPELDLTQPLPLGETIPPVLHNIYLELHEVFREIWRPISALDTMVQDVRSQFKLKEGLFGVQPSRGPVIGLHYRGGDKFAHECTFEMHCGNSTIYLEAALEILHKLPPSSCSDCKPVLALMTIEPDALELFQSNPLSAAFDIEPLPAPASGLKGHTQQSFNAWPIEERVDDTRTMMRDLTVLSLHADAFIVSGSSNVGITAMMLAGPSKLVQSVDWRFMATTRPLGWYAERGTDYRTGGQ